jgi:hypothetical protein
MSRLLLALALALVVTMLPARGEEPKPEASLCADLCQRAQYTELSTADQSLLGQCRAVHSCSNRAVPRSIYHITPKDILMGPQEHDS